MFITAPESAPFPQTVLSPALSVFFGFKGFKLKPSRQGQLTLRSLAQTTRMSYPSQFNAAAFNMGRWDMDSIKVGLFIMMLPGKGN